MPARNTGHPRPARRRARLVVVAWLCAQAAPFAAVAAADLESVKQAVAAFIEQERESEHVPGLSLALVDEHGVLWAEGFGYADVAHRTPARAETVYPAGTLTTPLTAAAILALAERGALDLDRPVQRYLPEFSVKTRFAPGAPITPRRLLTHHAGLPAARFRGIWEPRPLAQIVAGLKDEHAAYPPDYVHNPSDLGYDVLGRLIEVTSGQEFGDYMREHWLAPLGMRRSSFARAGVEPALLAKSYWRGRRELAALEPRDTPAAGLYTNVLELGQFVRMLLRDGEFEGRRLLRAGSVADMLRAQNAHVALDLDNRVGLGLRLSGLRLEHVRGVAWQSDASPAGRGRIVVLPEQKLGVVLLANSSLGSRLIDEAGRLLLEKALAARAPAPREPPAHTTTAAAAGPDPEELNGYYASMLGLIRVAASPQRIRARVLGKTFALKPQPDGRLGVEYRLLGLIPIPLKVLREVRLQPARVADRDLLLAHYKDQVYRLADRIAPEPLPAAWRARLGEYEVANGDALLDLVELRTIELRYDEGFLHFYYRLPGWLGLAAQVPLRPVSDSELTIHGVGWLMGETIEVVRRGPEERLRYSGYELRRLDR